MLLESCEYEYAERLYKLNLVKSCYFPVCSVFFCKLSYTRVGKCYVFYVIKGSRSYFLL